MFYSYYAIKYRKIARVFYGSSFQYPKKLTITKKFVDNLFQEISKKFEITQKVYESESFQFIKAIFDYVLEQRKKYHEVNNISYKANKIIDAVFSQAIQKAENENGM